MSTKLYNGLKFKDSLNDVFEVTSLIASAITPVFKKEARKLVSEAITRHVDSPTTWEDKSPDDYAFFTVEEDWTKQQASFGPHHALNDPLRFSIVFGRATSGKLLAYPFYSKQSYRTTLEGLGIFEDYHYQNQSDRPEEVTEADWDQRRADWDSLLDDSGSFALLPLWRLEGSMEVFSTVLMNEEKSFSDSDNCKPKHRLEYLLSTAVSAAACKLLAGEPINSRILLSIESNRVVREYLQSAVAEELPLPAALPDTLLFQYGELEPYEPPVELVQELAVRAAKTFKNR